MSRTRCKHANSLIEEVRKAPTHPLRGRLRIASRGPGCISPQKEGGSRLAPFLEEELFAQNTYRIGRAVPRRRSMMCLAEHHAGINAGCWASLRSLPTRILHR